MRPWIAVTTSKAAERAFCSFTDSSWQDWYASVEAAHDRLRQDCDIVIAGGLSMGALMALHLAHNRPKAVDGLALFAPTLRLDGWSMPWHSVLLRLIRPSPSSAGSWRR